MLKTKLLTVLVLLVSCLLQAQELSRHVFSSGGDSNEANGLQLSWTIGQSGLVGNLSQDSLVLTSGFQQGDTIFITQVNDITDPPLVKVFPNPFHQDFTFKVNGGTTKELSFALYDFNGKLEFQKHSKILSADPFSETIETLDYPPGLYTLVITFISQKTSDQKLTVKLIKQ